MIAVYDDRIPVPDEARDFVGIERFSRLVFRKRTLLEQTQDIVRSADIDRFVVLNDDNDAASLATELGRGPQHQRILYIPSSMVFPSGESARLSLCAFAYSDDHFSLTPEAESSAPPVLAMRAKGAVHLLENTDLSRWRALIQAGPEPFHAVENKCGSIDLTVRGRLIEFLSATFDARAVNRISQDDLLVTKRSTNVEKMRQEYQFYLHIEGPLRLFFLQPLTFREGPGWAEYQTERLFIPDVAVQWIHRAFDRDTFANLLGRLRAFLTLRPVRTLDSTAAVSTVEGLYLTKVDQRLAQLRASPVAAAVGGMLARVPGVGDLDTLIERYRRLWRQLGGQRKQVRQAVSHGDLCFSNMLYHRQSQQLKFIDPRGASNPDEVWLDEYYDVAKLSHSVLGLYDLINHDLVELRLQRDLTVDMVLEAADLAAMQADFRAEIEDMGFDVRLVRLYEASLFLSMVPLHADVPKKVVAFLITAARIMDEIET